MTHRSSSASPPLLPPVTSGSGSSHQHHSAQWEREREREEGRETTGEAEASSVGAALSTPEQNQGEESGNTSHLLIGIHGYFASPLSSIGQSSFLFSSASLPSSCLGYDDELESAGKPCAGDSVPARAHHHRPEPAESHPDAALPDRGAGPAGGRAYRREQAPAGRQGTAASLPSPP